MENEQFDFVGWATMNDIKCTDGRTIRHNAFADNDGQTVPLVWNHKHDDPRDVLGHALLRNRDKGVKAYCKFNDTEQGQVSKLLVQHGDVNALSIYANGLKQDREKNVMHGVIREVSLVLAGANPGAVIQTVLSHSDCENPDYDTDMPILKDNEIIISLNSLGCKMHLAHADEDEDDDIDDDDEEEEEEEDDVDEEEETDEDDSDDKDKSDNSEKETKDNKNKPKKEEKSEEIAHSDEKATTNDGKEDKAMAEQKEKTVKDVFDEFTDEQKNVVYFMIGEALRDAGAKEDEGGNDNMKHNIFEQDEQQMDYLSHDDMEQIFADAKRMGSLKEAVEANLDGGVLAHSIDTTGMDVAVGSQTYGFNDPSMLFPDAKTLSNTPDWISRNMDWVGKVLGGVHRTPFSRIKSIFANITEPEARAKGYIKGNEKKEQVFTTLKRTTTPQTIYKKQKLDKDDITDITDFDVVAWIRAEMRVMLNEEIARAILIGDGREVDSDDKINEANVRPIVNDVPLFNIKTSVNVPHGADDDVKAKATIRAAIKARKDYKGSGNPTLFTSEEWLTNMLLLEDGIGHKLYRTEAELATALRVKEIVTVEPMDGHEITINNVEYPLIGVIVNLEDYNVGADKGGAIGMFDDFDIDYNQYKYLIETRISGALIKPFSAITLYLNEAAASNP